MGIAPTGRRIRIPYMDFWRIEDGRIADNPVFVDLAEVLFQLGRDVFDGHGWEAFDDGRAHRPPHRRGQDRPAENPLVSGSTVSGRWSPAPRRASASGPLPRWPGPGPRGRWWPAASAELDAVAQAIRAAGGQAEALALDIDRAGGQ